MSKFVSLFLLILCQNVLYLNNFLSPFEGTRWDPGTALEIQSSAAILNKTNSLHSYSSSGSVSRTRTTIPHTLTRRSTRPRWTRTRTSSTPSSQSPPRTRTNVSYFFKAHVHQYVVVYIQSLVFMTECENYRSSLSVKSLGIEVGLSRTIRRAGKSLETQNFDARSTYTYTFPIIF